MNPVFGLGIANEKNFPLLPQVLPESIGFLEIPGDLLELPSAVQKLKKLSRRQHTAIVVRHLIPGYLAEAVPESPLRLKNEFDNKFRARCKAASELGCRVVSIDFDIPRALADAAYNVQLVQLLLSLAGTLEELKLIMAFPLRLPCSIPGTAAASFLAFKHRLFYPGFRYRIDFRYEEQGAFGMLENDLKTLFFDRNFWSLSYQPEAETVLSAEILERLRPAWKPNGRTPVFVCIEPGMCLPDEEMIRKLDMMIRDFKQAEAEKQ